MKLFNRSAEPERDPRFTREFFDGLERAITPPPPQIGPPRPRNILEKAEAYAEMDDRYHQMERDLRELAITMESSRKDIIAHLASDKRKTEERLEQIEVITARFRKNGLAASEQTEQDQQPPEAGADVKP